MKLHKPISTLLLCLLISGGCESPDNGKEADNNNTRPDEIANIKTPLIESNANTSIIATRKDASVEISYRYFDAALFYKLPSNDAIPDFYEVYLSKDSGNSWEMIRTVEVTGTEGSFAIDGLTNHELYYIYLKEKELLTVKEKNSNVALFVPSAFKPIYNFITADHYGNDLYSFGVNSINNSIVYATRFFEYEPGYAGASVFLAGSVGSPELIGTSCWFPDFSSNGSQIAYSSDKGEVFDGIIMPEHLFIYDVNTAIAKSLTSGYSVNKYPAWSTDNAKLAFSSSAVSDQALRISVYDAEDQSIQKVQEVTGLPGDLLSYSQERPAWSADGKYIYFTHRYFTNANANPGYYDIYRINLDEGGYEPVFRTPWIECIPVPSPDNSKLAFLSDLSGRLQVWIYDFNNGKLSQPFDTKDYHFSDVWSQIRWKNDHILLFAAYSAEKGGDISLFSISVE